MNLVKAARNTLSYIDPPTAVRDQDGVTLGHAAWMLTIIIQGHVQREKAHRWLGYAQAMVVCFTDATLVDMKSANKEA